MFIEKGGLFWIVRYNHLVDIDIALGFDKNSIDHIFTHCVYFGDYSTEPWSMLDLELEILVLLDLFQETFIIPRDI